MLDPASELRCLMGQGRSPGPVTCRQGVCLVLEACSNKTCRFFVGFCADCIRIYVFGFLLTFWLTHALDIVIRMIVPSAPSIYPSFACHWRTNGQHSVSDPKVPRTLVCKNTCSGRLVTAASSHRETRETTVLTIFPVVCVSHPGKPQY